MTNINKNITLNQFQELIEKNLNKSLDYMSDDFNYQQKQAVELFRKRIFLEEIIEESISFNKSLFWDNKNDNLKLTKSAEELIEVFKLRSEVYAQMGYQNDFPDVFEGLNFDLYDKKSAIIYYKINQEYTGTCRLIFDSTNKLPSDKEYSFDGIRKKYGIIGEISRNAVKNNQSKGLGLEFKYLMAGIHNVFVNNNLDITVSAMRKEHYKLFSKFGGIDIIEEINEYGNLKTPCVVIYWNPSEASTFFKKAFLK